MLPHRSLTTEPLSRDFEQSPNLHRERTTVFEFTEEQRFSH